MKEIPIGEYIRDHRRRQNMRIEDLAHGICDVSTLSRLERGKQSPSRSKITLLLQRLSLPEDQIYALVSAHDLEIRALKRDIRADMIQFERADKETRPQIRERAMKKLKELETLAGKDDRTTQQYILSSEVTLGGPQGPYTPAQRQKLLLRALRMTVPGFRLDRISQFRYGLEEMTILNMIARTFSMDGKREEAIDLYDQLLQNIEKNNQGLDRYASQFCLIAHNYAINLARAEQYKDAKELAERGRSVGIRYGDYEFLPGFLAIQAECQFYMGDREKSALLYTQAGYLYDILADKRNLALIRDEMRMHLGVEPPF